MQQTNWEEQNEFGPGGNTKATNNSPLIKLHKLDVSSYRTEGVPKESNKTSELDIYATRFFGLQKKTRWLLPVVGVKYLPLGVYGKLLRAVEESRRLQRHLTPIRDEPENAVRYKSPKISSF